MDTPVGGGGAAAGGGGVEDFTDACRRDRLKSSAWGKRVRLFGRVPLSALFENNKIIHSSRSLAVGHTTRPSMQTIENPRATASLLSRANIFPSTSGEDQEYPSLSRKRAQHATQLFYAVAACFSLSPFQDSSRPSRLKAVSKLKFSFLYRILYIFLSVTRKAIYPTACC